MKYGRLENNVVVEVIDHDPTGKYAPELVWVQLPDDITVTPDAHLQELQRIGAEAEASILIIRARELAQAQEVAQAEAESESQEQQDSSTTEETVPADAEVTAEETTPSETP